MSELSRENILHSLRNLREAQIMLSVEEVDLDIKKQIPAAWLDLISLDGIRFADLQRLWQPVVPKLTRVFDELARTIRGLAILLEEGKPPSLLYIFSKKEKLYYHRGFPPLEEGAIPAHLQPVWSKLPQDFRELYTIHNGWFALHSKSMGHLSIDKLSLLSSEDEWDLESEIINNMPIDPERTIIVFSNGGSGYIGFELPESEKTSEAKPLIWWSDKPTEPELSIKFWPVFDAWTAINFEEMDDIPF